MSGPKDCPAVRPNLHIMCISQVTVRITDQCKPAFDRNRYNVRLALYYITITGSASFPYPVHLCNYYSLGFFGTRKCLGSQSAALGQGQPVSATSCLVQPRPKTRSLFLKPVIVKLLQAKQERSPHYICQSVHGQFRPVPPSYFLFQVVIPFKKSDKFQRKFAPRI